MKKHIPLILSIYVAFVFIQSLYFKYQILFGATHPETAYIFDTIGKWMTDDIGLGAIGELFAAYGGVTIGTFELVASIILVVGIIKSKPILVALGSLLGLGLMSGAIFFHLFTPLGLYPYNQEGCFTQGCPQDVVLFWMACGVWLSCLFLVITNKKLLLALIGK